MWEKISGKYTDAKKLIIKTMIKSMENETLFKKGRESGLSCESYHSQNPSRVEEGDSRSRERREGRLGEQLLVLTISEN